MNYSEDFLNALRIDCLVHDDCMYIHYKLLFFFLIVNQCYFYRLPIVRRVVIG